MLVRSYITCIVGLVIIIIMAGMAVFNLYNVFCHVHQYIGKYDTLMIGLIQIWPNYINF